MIRVIVRNGRLEPLDPLPRNWNEGTELSIEVSMRSDAPNWQQQFEELEAHAAQVTPADMDELNSILEECDRQQKELVRSQWNLTP
jgi:hypothetical protein